MDGSAEAAGTPPPAGKLGTMRSFIKDFGRKLSFTGGDAEPTASSPSKLTTSESFIRLLMPSRNPDRYREGFDLVVRIPLKKDPSEVDPDMPDAGSVDMIDGFGGGGDGDDEEEEEEEPEEGEEDEDADYDGDYHDDDAEEAALHGDEFDDHAHGGDGAPAGPAHGADGSSFDASGAEGTEVFPGMENDEENARPDPFLDEGDLRAEHKRRLSFDVQHQRRLTFKRERAQSDASHNRAGQSALQAVAAIREARKASISAASGEGALASPVRPKDGSGAFGSSPAVAKTANGLPGSASLRRTPSSPARPPGPPGSALRRAQSMIRPPMSQPRSILKVRNREWLENPNIYRGTGGSLDQATTNMVERLRDDLRQTGDRNGGVSGSPPTDGGRPRRRIVFNETVCVIQTFRKTDYVRRPDPNATFLHLNNKVKRIIRQELNEFKRDEMLVHEKSFANTVFH